MKNTIKFSSWLSKWNNWDQIFTISLATCFFVVIVVILLGLKRRKKSQNPYALGQKQKHANNPRHQWHLNDLFTKPTYCNVCESLMVSGVCCTYCNLYADEKCLKRAEKIFKCKTSCKSSLDRSDCIGKATSTAADAAKFYKQNWSHHWVKGNLSIYDCVSKKFYNLT